MARHRAGRHRASRRGARRRGAGRRGAGRRGARRGGLGGGRGGTWVGVASMMRVKGGGGELTTILFSTGCELAELKYNA